MSYLAGAVALLSGGCFVVLGAVALWELLRERGRRGFSQFGTSLCAMLLICGAFHLAYAAYAVRGAGSFSLLVSAATLLGTVPVAAFTLLRVEALRGGRGDRFVDGTPSWLRVAPWALVFIAGMLAAGSIHTALTRGAELWAVWPPRASTPAGVVGRLVACRRHAGDDLRRQRGRPRDHGRRRRARSGPLHDRCRRRSRIRVVPAVHGQALPLLAAGLEPAPAGRPPPAHAAALTLGLARVSVTPA